MPTHVLEVNRHGLPNGLGVPVRHVLFDGQLDAYDFKYADSWLARHEAFPLSSHILLSDSKDSVGIKPGAVQRFLLSGQSPVAGRSAFEDGTSSVKVDPKLL